MSREDYEGYRLAREHHVAVGEERRNTSEYTFPQAERVAKQHGIGLRKCTSFHYRIWHGDWAINVYPGNQRICKDKGQRLYLSLPVGWNILSVVYAVVATLERKDG